MKEITVAARTDMLTTVQDFISAELEAADCPLRTVTQAEIAVDEIFSNICLYAYGDAGGEATVACRASDGLIEIVFSDSGIPYNPLKNDDPDITLSAEERQIGGLGIFMVKKTMDNVLYRHENGHNILTIQKKF